MAKSKKAAAPKKLTVKKTPAKLVDDPAKPRQRASPRTRAVPKKATKRTKK